MTLDRKAFKEIADKLRPVIREDVDLILLVDELCEIVEKFSVQVLPPVLQGMNQTPMPPTAQPPVNPADVGLKPNLVEGIQPTRVRPITSLPLAPGKFRE